MKNFKLIMMAIMICFIGISITSCDKTKSADEVNRNGIKKAEVKISIGSDGLTMEQRNIKRRLKTDNEIGSIKHLYVISAMSGEVILYSTVDGKVTSGGKRLTSPVQLKRGDRGSGYGDFVMPAMQDDGTFGNSMNYLYWYDVKGVYHQHYVNGGQIVHISDQALPVGKITINLVESNSK